MKKNRVALDKETATWILNVKEISPAVTTTAVLHFSIQEPIAASKTCNQLNQIVE